MCSQRIDKKCCLTHFIRLVSIYEAWKHEKTKSFLMFPGDIERDHCQEMGKHNFWSQEIKMLRGVSDVFAVKFKFILYW